MSYHNQVHITLKSDGDIIALLFLWGKCNNCPLPIKPTEKPDLQNPELS